MSDIEKRDASDLGQFGALTAEQQAMVNAFAEMVRRGQVPVPSGEPSHIKGDLPQRKATKGTLLKLTTLESVWEMIWRPRV